MFNYLVIIFSLSLLLSVMTGRLSKYINILAVQGIILFLLIIISFHKFDFLSLSFLTVETLIFKAIVVPRFLRYTIIKNEISREMQANIPAFYSLLIGTSVLSLSFAFSYLASKTLTNFNTLYFGTSIATILISLFLILTRKKIITHVMCFLMLENGIFLLSMSVAHEMPFLINLAVLLDLFLAILLLGVFTAHIKSNFDELNVDSLTMLKE